MPKIEERSTVLLRRELTSLVSAPKTQKIFIGSTGAWTTFFYFHACRAIHDHTILANNLSDYVADKLLTEVE